MKKKKYKFLVTVLTFLCLSLPILVFQKLFLNDLEYYNPYENVWYVHLCIPFLYSIVSVLLIPRKYKGVVWRSCATVFISAILIFEFYGVAYLNRSSFGATWTATEVFWELVWSQKYFIPLLFIGIALNYVISIWDTKIN